LSRQALLLSVFVGLGSTSAFAQSTQLVAERQATAKSIADAVWQNEQALIDGEVFGGGSATGRGGQLVGMFTTGRVRASDHTGLDIRPVVTNPGVPDDGIRHTFSFKTQESSLIGNVVFTAPELVNGGQVKVSGFVGGNWLSFELKPNSVNPGIPGMIGSGGSEALIVGGSALWVRDGLYTLATVVGTWGRSHVTDFLGDSPNIHGYNYDTSGFIGMLTAGKVFPLTANATGPQLDLRGTVAYNHNKNDPFLNVFGDQFIVRFSTWTGTAAATLFSNMSVPNGAVFRPYISGYVRQEFGYDYSLAFTQSGSGAYTLTKYDQNHLYGGVDIGMSYVIKNMTLGASIYFEASNDERTLGGRLRASWQFN